ncbi:hypothetical protein Purlil1_1849 [Purpureocillium lilacinum]|uniref:Uncharacterized protein n=1 Tax=Purpureocillium lilacinum TaxID=33203 RepID=A0ABR0CBG9_PURLI|nr:hypothetical protein Purlil1_1849 [Purpureocillium lilacinum]
MGKVRNRMRAYGGNAYVLGTRGPPPSPALRAASTPCPKPPTTRSRPPQSLPAIRRQTSTFGTSSAPLPQSRAASDSAEHQVRTAARTPPGKEKEPQSRSLGRASAIVAAAAPQRSPRPPTTATCDLRPATAESPGASQA